MVKELEPVGRQILTPTQSLKTTNAFAGLGDAAAKLSSLVSNKLSDVAVDQASSQGVSDAMANTAPDNLAPSLTKATKAYNDAVSDTEARHITSQARKQIEKLLIESSDPSKFNTNTPAIFNAQLQGIVQGTLEGARPSNKKVISNALEQLETQASTRMLDHSIDYDNKVIKQEYQQDITELLTEAKNAAIAGDSQRVKDVHLTLDEAVSDYGDRSNELKRLEPEITKRIDQAKTVNSEIGGYVQALSEGNQVQWLADFSSNTKDLPFDVWQQVSTEALAVNAHHQQMMQQASNEDFAAAKLAIDERQITQPYQLDVLDNLTVTQSYQLQDYMDKSNQIIIKSTGDTIDAQRKIANKQAALLSGKQMDSMFDAKLLEYEQATGKPASLIEMAQIVDGTSDFALSGTKGIGSGRSVPRFDEMMSNYLTSKNSVMTAQAALAYQNIVIAKKQPNLVNINGQALTVAQNTASLSGGDITPDMAAQMVIDTTLNVSDENKKFRATSFNKEMLADNEKKLRESFKDNFDAKALAFGTGGAYNKFKESVRFHFITGGNMDGAIKAAKFDLKGYGKSKWYPPGYIDDAVPETEVPVSGVGNVLNNQFRLAVQGAILKNSLARKQIDGKGNTKKIPVIEWASEDEVIDYNKMNDSDKIHGMSKAAFNRWGITEGLPRIKIDGHEADVYMVPTAQTRLGERLSYGLGYFDKFNNFQMIQDPYNETNGLASFSPMPLSEWAPNVADSLESNQADRLTNKIIETNKRQRFQDANKAWRSINKEDRDKAAMLFREAFNKLDDVESIRNDVLASLHKNKKKELVNKPLVDATSADNVSIQPPQSTPESGG